MKYLKIILLLSIVTILMSCQTLLKDEDIIKKVSNDALNEVIDDSIKEVDPQLRV